MTFLEAAIAARAALVDAGIQASTAALDADLLARHAADWDLTTWLQRRSESANDGFRERYDRLIARRLKREPVAYIRGVQEFWGREFLVTPDVLIPRPETELLVETALAFLAPRLGARTADVGTGSGCIAITLAAENPALSVVATDLSAAALAIARQNAERLGVHARVDFIAGAYLAGVAPPLDLIVANLPYVSERDRPGLAPEVREHEPSMALFGGHDGWRDIRELLRQARAALDAGGRLMMEIGYGQSERIAAEVEAAGGLSLETIREDLQGIPRVAVIAPRASG